MHSQKRWAVLLESLWLTLNDVFVLLQSMFDSQTLELDFEVFEGGLWSWWWTASPEEFHPWAQFPTEPPGASSGGWVKYSRTHSLALLIIPKVRNLNTTLSINIVGTGYFSDGLLLSQSRQRIICLNNLRTILQVSSVVAFNMTSLSKSKHLSQALVFLSPHLRWRLLTSLARSPSTLVSSTIVIKSSPIGWTCCHGTSFRTKKRLVKKGINHPLAFWASPIWLWWRSCLLFSHKCPFVSQAFPSAGCSRVDKLLRVQCQCVRAVRRYATLCLGLHLSQCR